MTAIAITLYLLGCPLMWAAMEGPGESTPKLLGCSILWPPLMALILLFVATDWLISVTMKGK